MAPAAAKTGPPSSSSPKGALTWRPTKIMNMRDLSKDDDFLSHLLVEKLGTGAVPLLVHKMDPSRRLPKTDAQDLMAIVRRLVTSKGHIQHTVRQAVDELLTLLPVLYYLKSYTQKQINAFATHASRYFELYNPSGYIEIAHTSRYSHRTGKSELCILATRNLPAGTVITELKGSMANLTDEEDRELKRTDIRNSDVRRDFSVIHSKQMKKNHLFLGPARFVNHDCDNNCELFREGKYITFRTLRAIPMGAEITAHYGDCYFGRKNRHCLCETCEKLGRGGYAPQNPEDDIVPSESDSDSDSDVSSCNSDNDETSKLNVNFNERRTRRGVYAVLAKKDEESDDSDDEDGNVIPLAGVQDVPADGDIELTTDLGTPSELTSLSASVPPSDPPQKVASASALDPDSRLPSCSSLSSLSCESGSTPKPTTFRSIISTRRQKANEDASTSKDSNDQLDTPPLSEDADSAGPSIVAFKRVTRSASTLQPSAMDKGKARANEPASSVTPTKKQKVAGKAEVKVKKEEVEPRSLRVRPSPVTDADSSKDASAQPSVPTGPDGKPLPTCVTCSSVLPVISVDSKVVWGLGLEGSPRKKKNKQECPRCMRHFEIYGQSWPVRAAPHGSGFLPTPREEPTPTESSKRFSKKSLSIVNDKLAKAVSTSAKNKKRDDDDSAERPAKRQKTEHSSKPEAEPQVKKVALKAKEKKRHSLPEPPPGEKRKRGRPRLSSPRRKIKVEEQALTLGRPQPRNANGRFEKKIRIGKRTSTTYDTSASSSHTEATPRQEAQKGARGERMISGTWTSPRRKRPSETNPQVDAQPRKRPPRQDEDVDVDMEPFRKVLPRSTTNFKGGRLFLNPNPLTFARQAWAPPVGIEESSDDEKPPITPPEEGNTAVVSTTIIDVGVDSVFPSPTTPFGALTFKPSPFNFAKRRWVSTSSSCTGKGARSGGPTSDLGTSRSNSREEDGDRLLTPALGRKGPLHHNFSTQFTFRPGFSHDGKERLEDEEESLSQLTPLSDEYPSALSPEDETQGSRPEPVGEMDRQPAGPAVPSNEGPIPNLVNAGWDSCSELSDI